MGQTLQDFFAGPVMTELANSEAIKRGLPLYMPDGVLTPSPEKPVGLQIKFKQFKGNRATAQLVHQASGSREVEVLGANWQYATALGTREHFVVDQDFLYQLMSGVDYVKMQAKAEFTRRMADFRERQDNLRKTLVCSAFAKGAIYADGSGNILSTSSGAVQTVSFGTQAFTKATNYPNVSTYAVGDWSSASTDIPSSLRTLRESFRATSNYNPVKILYGKAIPGYLYGNTAMQAYLSRQPMLNQQFMDTNEVPKGLLDFEWFPAYNNYYVDSAGTVQQWFADNQIVVIPDLEPNWYEFFEAGTLIPTTVASEAQNIEQLLTNVKVVNGKFAYATMSTDPIKLKAISGDYFLPTIKNGLVVWSLTVS